MTDDRRNEICMELFNTLLDRTNGQAADMTIIAKRMLIGLVQSISKTDGVKPETTNRAFETLAHEFLSYAPMEFAEPIRFEN